MTPSPIYVTTETLYIRLFDVRKTERKQLKLGPSYLYKITLDLMFTTDGFLSFPHTSKIFYSVNYLHVLEFLPFFLPPTYKAFVNQFVYKVVKLNHWCGLVFIGLTSMLTGDCKRKDVRTIQESERLRR